MTSVFKIHDIVMKVSVEAKDLLPEMPTIRKESKLLSELVLCILSSQEKYELALSVIRTLQKKHILQIPRNKWELNEIKKQIQFTFSNPVCYKYNGKEYSRRLRFYLKKGQYIVDTIENIYLNNLTIKEILDEQNCIQETRKNIINYSCGLGPKQASMFLRNIGYYSDFAVLDKHVIDYMRIMGLTCVSGDNFSNISTYQKIETKLKSYADTYKVNLLHLDLAIWTTMRTLKSYNV